MISDFASGLLTGFIVGIAIPFQLLAPIEGSYYGPTELFDKWIELSFQRDTINLHARYLFILIVSISFGFLFAHLGSLQ